MTTVYFATNRNIEGTGRAATFGNHFNRQGPHAVRFGRASVTGEEFDRVTYQILGERLTRDPSKRVLGSVAAFQAVMDEMRDTSCDTLVLIHGYAADFNTALSRAAELKSLYAAIPLNVVVFSWPANGSMIPWASYYSDRDDAKASGDAIARTIIKIHDFLVDKDAQEYCQQNLHLLAHSMGNYALRHAFQRVRAQLGDDLPRLFNHIFLMASDEDDDAFEKDHKFRLLPRIARRVHIYFNPGDRALFVSDATKGNPDRLGSDGPRLIDALPRKINLINCENIGVKGDRWQLHQYYRTSREVVADVNAVLSGVAAEKISDREYAPATRSFKIRAQGG